MNPNQILACLLAVVLPSQLWAAETNTTAAVEPLAIRITAVHFGYHRFHEYEITNGFVKICEIRVADKKELSAYEAKFTGQTKEDFEKATGGLFRQILPSTKANPNVRDGTQYTVLMKFGGTEKKIVNYEEHDERLSSLFREINKIIPQQWQLHNPS